MAIDNIQLFRDYRQSADENIRNIIAEKYLYIAEIIAKKFSGRGVDYDDLFQVASLALLKGIDRFDESKNLQFSTFITPTIAGEIKNYFRDKSKIIKVPRKLYALSSKLKAHSEQIMQQTGRQATPKELAAYFDITEEDVIYALEQSSSVISLDSSVEGIDSNLYEIIPDDKDFFADFETNDEVSYALSKLTDNERELIKLRFKKGLSQTEVSNKWQVSQMYISRMERKIITKLQGYVFKG